MPHRWSRLVALGGLACMFAVSGCVGAEPGEPSPSPTASDEPVFASEEEALAAATEVYEGYRAAADAIVVAGGTGIDRLAPFVTEEHLAEENDSYEPIRARGLRGVGQSTYDNLRLQDFNAALAEGDLLQAYVCSDVTDVRLVDTAGADVTPPDRDNRLPLVLSFLVTADASEPLLIDGSDLWSGDNFC